MNEKYRLTIDGGTDNAFVKDYTKEELEAKKDYIDSNYKGRYKVDAIGDADTGSIDDNSSYTVKIDDSGFSKDYTGAELKGKMDYLNQNYSGRYRVETSLGSWDNMDSVFAPTPSAKDQLNTFRQENGAFLDDYEARDSAEAKQAARAGMTSGVYVPSEGSITADERQRYSDLRKQEEELKKAYYTSDDYLQSQLQAGEKLSEQRDLIYAEANQYAQEHPIVESGTAFIPNPAAGRSRGAEADKESQMYDTAKRIIDDTIKLHNAPSRYDKGVFWRNIGKFFKGAGEKASDIDLWTAGLSEITDNFKVRDVLESVQNKLGNLNDLSEDAIEGILSPAEKSVLKAWALNAQTQMARSEDLSRGYQAGQGAVESLGFMAEFALTGGIGKAASEGTEAFAKWLGKKALGTFKGMSDEVAEKTVKELGEKITGNVVGKYAANLANSLAEAAGRTGVMPSTFRNISEKATEIKTDENGNNYLVGMNEAFGKGLADSFIETLSEGGRVGALGELVGDVAGKIPSYARFVDHLSKSDMADLYKAFRSSGIMNTLRAGGWHGIGEEYLEEWYGNALRTLTGVDKDALKDYATVDNQIITVTSFLPMTIFGGSVSTAQVLSAKKGLDKKAAALQSALLERGYDEAQARNMIDMMRGATPSEMSDVLTPIVNKVAETSEKDAAILMRPIGDFALAVRKWQSFNTAYNYQEQEQRDNLFARMNENLGQFWQEKEDGTKVVETAVTDKGENVYLLAKPSADVYAQTIAEGEKVIPEAVPAITFDGRKMFVQQGSYKVLDELKMNDFLGAEIMSEKKNKEQARMIEEKEQRISQIRSIATTGSVVNIGTEEAPQQATVLQAKTDSAVLAMPDGSAREVTWEELGNYVGVNAEPQTDEQIDEQESETILAESEQREAELDQEYNNDADAIQELEEAEANIDAAVEAEESIPLKADGSVDQTALWNQSPEKWAKWNDEKRQDNGANSLNYITAALFKAQQDLAETAAAYDAELDFDTKESLEDEMATMQQRVERLASLQQTYMPKETEQVPQKTMLSAGLPAAEEAAPQRSIEAEVSRLYDLGLNDEEVQQNLDAKIAEAQKEISKQAKRAPKMGADAEAYVSKKREYEERMQKLQEEVDFWTGVKDEITNLKAQETQIPEAPVVEMEKDPEPMNAVEFAARELGLKEGGIKLRWDSFKHHTGYGNEEKRKMFGLFKNKQDGGLTLEEAGERLMEMDRENNTGFFDQNDPNAGLDAILDVLGANSTIGELRTYTSRQRQSEAQRDADAAYSAMMAEYESTHGMTIEDAAAADAVQRGEIMQKALTKEQYNELNNIFAEEIYQNESRRTQTEAQGVYGAEARADESDVESGTDGAREESDQILPGEQAGISGTVEESELRHIEGRSNGDESDGLPPVSSRESTAEVESDLDEDMPDFESMSDEEIAEIASDLFDHKQTKMNTLRDRISWWEKHLGTKIDVYDNPNDVTNSEAKDLIESGKRVFGWFETESGTVALYLPSYALYPEATAMEMINRKIAHEIIAHKGLRGLLGEKQYNELCDRVFEQMTPETQTRFLSYASVNGDARKAADEFIAHLAENVELSEQERTIWDKIVDFIKNLFFARITTDDLSKLIRQSYTQLKNNAANPAINSNANQQAEGNALFSLDDGSLVGMHNISEEKLKKVIKQGGLANPSTAVIDISSQSFTSYGDISLVMPSSLVDAKSGRNAGTFTADAWTPVYPQVSKRFSNDKGQRRYWKDIAAIPEEMQGEARQGFDGWTEGRNSSGLAYMFLLERNEAPGMVRVQARFSDVLKNDLLAILGKDRDSLYELSDEEKQAVIDLYIQQEFNGSREEFNKSIADTIARIEDRLSMGKVPSFVEKRITMDLQWMKEHGYNYENLSKFVGDIISDIRHAGEVNDAATTNLAIDYIRDNNLVQEFELWKESLDERYGIKEYLWGGYTPSGNQRWLPNTIENASKLMNQQGLAGAVGITASFSRFVATLAPKVKSLSDIKSSKDRLVEDEKLVDEFRDKWSEVFYDLGVKCQPDARGYEDYGLARLIEAAQKKNPGAYLKKEYNVELSKEDLQKLSEMISAIKNDFPARYFETKFQRPVYLNEFAAAVMPTTTSDDVKKAVSEAGLPIYEYDSDVKGARAEATRKAAAIEGVRFSYEDAMPQHNTMFSLSNENQAIFVSNAAKAVESIKMEKATPEQWLKMIEKNGGLKAGEDKWMGLSDWLKSSDKKTLSKEEVLNFINDNMIVIQEQHYSEIGADDLYEREVETQEALQGIFDEYVAESQDMNDDIFMRTHYDYAIQMLAETLGYQAWNAPFINNGSTIELNYYDDIDDLNTLRNRLGLTNVKGEREINATRLDFTTEGLTDKHEIALTVPSIDSWNEGDIIHFGDAGNGRAIAWIRFGDITDEDREKADKALDRMGSIYRNLLSKYGDSWRQQASSQEMQEYDDASLEFERWRDGRKVLVIDEIQSKRHQEGREKGYRVSNIEQWLKDNNVEVVESDEFYEFIKNGETDRRFSKGLMKYDIDKAKRLYVSGYNKSDIPAAPFEKNWHELAMKRMLRYAAENGYDVIAWTKGEQQAERYGLAHVVNDIYVSSSDIERYVSINTMSGDRIEVPTEPNSDVIVSGEYKGHRLSDVVGKELAEKILGIPEGVDDYISGDDLKVGGEGMKGFYDKMLPAFMSKYGKKWGVKVEDIYLPNLENGLTMHSVPVTEEMKASVMEGQTMFSVVTPEQDAEYLAAVEAGDMETAQKMVNEAAKRAMPNTKVVDENGNPLVVYHGTNLSAANKGVPFWTFYEDSHFGTEAQAQELARAGFPDATRKIYSVFLDIRNIKRVADVPQDWIKMHSEYWEPVNQEAKAEGYDGLVYANEWEDADSKADSYIAFEPFQIKSADPVTYDDAGNVIPLSERFNPESSDIRFSVEESTNNRTSARYSAEERRIINELFPGALQEEPRTAPSKDEVPEIIDDLFEQADSSKNKVQRKIISSVTPRQLEEYRKKGILNVTADFVHSIENTALRHENKRHSGDNRTQQPLTKEEWHNILDVIENFDTVEKQKSRSGLDVIVYKKKNNDGTIYYVEEIRTGRKSLALTTAYKKRGDSSELMADALPQTSETTLDNTSFDDKDSDNSENSNTLFSVGAETDEAVAEGISLSSAQMASLAGNIYADLPDSIRGKIIDDLKGDYLNLQNAIMQIPARLAMKEEWNEEDQIVADVIARQMTKAIDKKISRPLTATEALWMLFDATHKDTDFISEASRAVVRRNLGFDQQTIHKEQQAKSDVRFSVASNASINATANLYNREVVNARTRLKESYVDMNASVEEFVKALEKSSGKKVQGFENILMALNQQSSKGLAAMESYERKFLNPMFAEILKIVKDNNKKYEDIVRYVILKHGLERNNIFAKRDAREYYRSEYDKLVASINADDSLDEARKKKAIDKAEKELDAHLADVDAEIDSKYAELKEKDYSGISSMFYDQLGVSRKDYDTEEAYQAALMAAKQNKYATLADVENAAEMEVQDFERDVNTEGLWKSINAATKETLRQQYEANMISRDQYESLRDMFKYYVPLRGFKDNTAEDMYTYYRQPNPTGYTRPILGAEGRKTEAESPFGWIASMANSAIASNVKNEAKLALYYFVSNRPENGLATISKTWYMQTGVDADGKKIFSPTYPPFTESLSSEKAKADYEAWQESMQALRKEGKAYEGRQKLNLGDSVVFVDSKDKPEHIVNVKVGGKDYSIIINGNPRAAQAINGDLNVETDPDYSQVFGRILRWMSSVNTSYNPEFWMTNMQRDMLFTLMAVSAKEDPAYRKRFAANYAKALKVVKLNAQYEKGTIGDSYLEKMYEEFVANGGVTGYTQIKGNEEWEKEIDKYLQSHNPEAKKMGRLMGATKDAVHAFHRFGESLEQVSRFAAFLTSREMGKSMEEAINDAKEITVNFNRKGSGKRISWEETAKLTDRKGQPLNGFERGLVYGLSWMAPIGRRCIMFFNAAIQGLNSMYKLYKNNPSKMAAWSIAYASLGVMNAVLHSLMDDDDDEYMDLPDYERRTSFLLGGNGVYFKWALPQEARAFYALGDLAVETILGRNPQGAGKVLGDALNIATDVLPVNPTEGWKAFVPSVAVPFVELLANKDYKGDPIYNEQKWLSKEEKKRTAKWSNAYSGTGTLYIGIAKVLNNITGGDEFNAGLVNIQPEKLEHIVQSAFGGTVRTADKFFNLISAAIDSEEPVTIRQTPFLNRLLTIGDERFRNAYVNEIYDYYVGEAEHALTLQKKYQKARDKEAYRELMQSEDMKVARIYDKYKKPIKKIQDQIKVAEGTAEKKDLMHRQDELKKMMIMEISNL